MIFTCFLFCFCFFVLLLPPYATTEYVVIFAVVLFSQVSPDSRKFQLQYMAIYSNENITKIVKLSHCEFAHLVQNCENICTQNIWCTCIQYYKIRL